MAWCKLEDTFNDDPKWDRVADLSGLCRATVAGHVAILYSWCLRHAPDGVLDMPKNAICRAMGFEGNADQFIDALLKCAVLDSVADGYEVHGYARRSESYNRAKQKQKERDRQIEKKPVDDNINPVSPDSRPTVAEMSPTERRGEEKRRDDKKLSLERERKASPGSPAALPGIPQPESFATVVGRRFKSRFEEATGRKVEVWGAKANGQLATWGKSISLEAAIAVVDAFFASPNPAYRAKRYPLAWMLTDAEALFDQATDGRAYAEQAAARVQTRQHGLAAANGLAVEEALRRMRERA